MPRFITPTIWELSGADLASGLIKTRRGMADLLYPELHRGAVLAMPFSLGQTGGTSLDVSGYRNNGTLTNGPTWQGRDGLSFDGTNDYVDTNSPISDLFSQSTGVMAAWIKPSSAGSTIADAWHGRGIMADRNGFLGLVQGSIGGDDRIWAWNWDGSQDRVGAPYVVNAWQHVAWTHVSGQLSVAINGEIVGSVASGNSVITTNLYIGLGYIFGTNKWFDGIIDDARIYNREITAAEIAQLYTAGRPGETGGIYQARLRPKVFAFGSSATPWLYARRQSQIIGSGLGV